jgi:hypothetical protein
LIVVAITRYVLVLEEESAVTMGHGEVQSLSLALIERHALELVPIAAGFLASGRSEPFDFDCLK